MAQKLSQGTDTRGHVEIGMDLSRRTVNVFVLSLSDVRVSPVTPLDVRIGNPCSEILGRKSRCYECWCHGFLFVKETFGDAARELGASTMFHIREGLHFFAH